MTCPYREGRLLNAQGGRLQRDQAAIRGDLAYAYYAYYIII